MVDVVWWALDSWEQDRNAALGDAVVLGAIVGAVLAGMVHFLFREAEKVVGPGRFWWWAQVVTAAALLACGGILLRELIGLQATVCTVVERRVRVSDDAGATEVLVRVRWDAAGKAYTTRELTPVASLETDDPEVYPVGSTLECVTSTRVPPEVWGTSLARRNGDLAFVLAAVFSASALLAADALRRMREARAVQKRWGWNELGKLAALVLLCVGAVAYGSEGAAWGIAVAVLGVVVLVAVTIREVRE